MIHSLKESTLLFKGLKHLFSSREEVAFAVLFGSAASDRLTAESDVDIAVYFVPSDSTAPFDLEEPNARFESEHELWSECEEICGRNVDLVVLNRAPATIAAAALLTGSVVEINRPGLFRAYFNAVTSLAEEFRDFVEDYIRISRRSGSLSPIDRDRLLRIVEYIRLELKDALMYSDLSRKRFSEDGHYRRGMERWIENLVNASIDAAKIILASNHASIPQTYRGQMARLGELLEFEAIAKDLARNTRIRNALAHEYLDLRYEEVKSAVKKASSLYGEFVKAVGKWLERNSE